MFCANCGTEAKGDAQFCHQCGRPLQSAALPALAGSAPAAPAPASLSPAQFKRRPITILATPSAQAVRSQPMGSAAVRQGMTQAKFNEENSSILFGEIMLIAIVAGLVTSSWWWFGGVFLGFILALNIRPLGSVLAFLLSLGWGVLGYGIGMIFGSQAASIVLGLLGFMCGLGVHQSALQWLRDV